MYVFNDTYIVRLFWWIINGINIGAFHSSEHKNQEWEVFSTLILCTLWNVHTKEGHEAANFIAEI